MRTWQDYKEYVKNIDENNNLLMEEIDELTAIVSAMIEKRNALGISQRELAQLCGLPQSSIARIESGKTTPKLDTLLKIMHPLGLKIKLVSI
ncbi:helix-turn-helix transcriptional regulator [Phascolarctobacterium sp. Marseille-Q4147]|uniref:helix-turn-helix domain-containing protein n=1 Tax=Phascolarctobacterium sp. Marseille-Q4147 TaxID=2823317 RepID=UPI001B326AB7|nr:helix-turn-helix transcriptional regulator [Phascolarctobacterium sp. Marseille-Q4147]QTV78555.1 helix-turn-helix transcriptional regulator [Phascolarctobacterium sp. Marseille-Q4147]